MFLCQTRGYLVSLVPVAMFIAREGPEGPRAWSPWPQKVVSRASSKPAARKPRLTRGDYLVSEPQPKALPHIPCSPPTPISIRASSACSQTSAQVLGKKKEARAFHHGRTLCNARQQHRHANNPERSQGRCCPLPRCSVSKALRNGGSYQISDTMEPIPNLIFSSAFH